MKGAIIILCLIGVVFSNPISFSAVVESNELDPNTTESLSVSQSSENDTAEIQSSEQSMSSQSQSSESESIENTSEDTTSEESESQSESQSDSQSDSRSFEDDEMVDTRDNSMGSEENVRKSWVQVFASVIKAHSAEDNSSSTEITGGQSDQLTDKQPTQTATASPVNTNLLVDNPSDSSDTTSDSSDTTSDSADTSEVTAVTAATSDSSESTSSESNETSETSDSSDTSESTEDSNASDSSEMNQMKSPDCVNGTLSCESEEYFFQNIGDDAHHSVDNLMMPDEDERELTLRR